MSTSLPTCSECGQPAGDCYNICPTQDPFQGDQYAEHVAHEEGARYDDVRERYASEIRDMELEALAEAEYDDEPDYIEGDVYAGHFETFHTDDIPF